MKPGKLLGGKPARRGGKLTSPNPEAPVLPVASTQFLLTLALVFLLLGVAGGYVWAVDRQLRGGLLAQRLEAQQREDWVTLESLPEHLIASLLLVVDPWADSAERPVSGMDLSLTRDLVRQVHMLDGGLPDQARQLVMTPLAEQYLEPRELVELYVNRVYLGESGDYRVFGVKHAAMEYLGKDPSELTFSESATLAGLLLPPLLESPQDHPGAVGARRNEVLTSLFAAGLIDRQQFDRAMAEPLGFQPGLDDLPMTRRPISPQDTVVIRLPRSYPEAPEEGPQ